MGRYIYTIKDLKTGEVLFVGGEGTSAQFLDCEPAYLSSIGRRAELVGRSATYGNREITREWEDTIAECRQCGVKIENVRPTQKYCRQCAADRRRGKGSIALTTELLQEDGWHPSVREKQLQMQKNCKGCIYFGGENYMNATCNYIFIVGHRRECPGGDGCAKRRDRKR